MNAHSALTEQLGIGERTIALVAACEDAVRGLWPTLERVCGGNQAKVLAAMRAHRLSDTHFGFATGYGYGDAGRQVTEAIFADIFGAESALVRTQFVNGTHAIATAMAGALRPGDRLLYCSGAPYDTLRATIGIAESTADPAGSGRSGGSAGQGTLFDFGIGYAQIELTPAGGIDYAALEKALLGDSDLKMAALQRATGYSERPAITTCAISEWARFVKQRRPDVVCFVDNCYGEFLETREPTDVGADLMAGSLIKNPGGGLALSGGYVAGRRDLVEKAAYRLTCPGIGGECGLTFGQTRTMLQGLFLAPRTVMDAVKGAILCGAVFEKLGFSVFPAAGAARSDIVETVRLGSAQALVAFCEGIQAASPVDSFARPEPWAMPGYADEVVMASGSFITGSSIELSADGPLREPYNVYFQGGLTYDHARIGVMSAVQRLFDKGLLDTNTLSL
ncbi:MAG: methionine gamma-lyase family protein [Clostridiales Family XIII bacterium]|jgi:cystathionine beta-lyase family protein involved in aluminum resistance|nr:methionine gamma-lyase family protein [Clostridiales Family XIII bacterium]